MRFTAHTSTGHVDYEVAGGVLGARVVDLATAAGIAGADSAIDCDGSIIPTHTSLMDAPIAPGAQLGDPSRRSDDATATPIDKPHNPNLGIVGGWSSSERVDLSPGHHIVGSQPAGAGLKKQNVDAPRLLIEAAGTGITAEPIAGAQAHLDAEPLTTRTRMEGHVARIDTAAFAVLDPTAATAMAPAASRLGAATHGSPLAIGSAGGRPTPFNRPPRVMPPEEVAGVDLPAPPEAAKRSPVFSWMMVLAPLPIGIMMAVLLSPRFALFILMSPLMAIGRWIEGRKASKTDSKRYKREFEATLAEASALLAVQRNSEEVRRRTIQPNVAELRRRAELGAPTLWERRAVHPDFLQVAVGWGDVDWQPPLDGSNSTFMGKADDFVVPLIEANSTLKAIPVTVNLDSDRVVGIAGPRAACLALARSMVLQAATLSGPADLELMLATDDNTLEEWDWLKWLAHAESNDGTRVAVTLSEAGELIEDLPTRSEDARPLQTGDPDDTTRRLIIVDSDALATSPGSPIRPALRNETMARAIVISPAVERLPATCGAVITIDEADTITLHEPGRHRIVTSVLPTGVSAASAATWARSLSKYSDADATSGGAGVPSAISLVELLGIEDLDNPRALVNRWTDAGVDPSPRAMIGMTGMGPLTIDLVSDGPHALIAGTTGSGKSELLRSMVTSMAAEVDPSHLNFVLIDFKGGGAFDVCVDLPHVVSVVTDLDDHLAERALRCLKAELRHREETLRAAGATDLSDYLHDGNPALPRLVVIVDEFATLAVELPEFMTSLVDIAQRGRSLGVHMVLATQRPSGVLDAKIRANTNLRIALRVQDKGDSTDVIGCGDAAALGRRQAGRAYCRFGSSEIIEFQSALVTGVTPTGDEQLDVRPFTLRTSRSLAPSTETRATADENAKTDIELFSDAIGKANQVGGYPVPRVPWPDPLPDAADCAVLFQTPTESDRQVPYGLADIPDEQRQEIAYWTPTVGNTLFYGADATSTTQALASIALGLAFKNSAEHVHLYVMDFAARELAPLDRLAHCGGYAPAGDNERIDRMIALMDSEIDRRRELGPAVSQSALPMIMFLIDNMGGLREYCEDEGDFSMLTTIGRIVRDGPGLGLYTLATGASERAFPTSLANIVGSKVGFAMADRNSYMHFGIRPAEVPDLGPLRAIEAVGKREVQFATYAAGDVARAVHAVPTVPLDTTKLPSRVRILPTELPIAELDATGYSFTADSWRIPVGLGAADLQSTVLELPAGESAIVSGPTGAGRSTALQVIAHMADKVAPDATIIAITTRRSCLRSEPAVDIHFDRDTVPEILTRALDNTGNLLVLVDDAELLPPELSAPLVAMLAERRENIRIIAGARPDSVRDFSSWLQPMRQSRTGILLKPSIMDGDVLKSQLPLRQDDHFPVGGGFVVNQGQVLRSQIALPAAHPETASAPTVV